MKKNSISMKNMNIKNQNLKNLTPLGSLTFL